jgi:hypothetical protein
MLFARLWWLASYCRTQELRSEPLEVRAAACIGRGHAGQAIAAELRKIG